MTHPQDVPAPSPTVSEAMPEAVAQDDAREKRLADIVDRYVTDCTLVHRTLSEEEVWLLEGLAFGPIASALAALERENATLRAERDTEAEMVEHWKATLDAEMEIQAEVRADNATLRASAERMEAALVMARQAVANSVEMHRPWAEEIAGRVNPWQSILDAADAALNPKETPDA